MIRIHDLSIPPLPESERRVLLEKKIRRFAGGILPSWKIARRSVDARKKEEIRYIYTVDLEEMGEKKEAALLKRARGFKAEQIKIEDYRLPEAGQEVLAERPLIIGAGPAGLFAAWMLATAGYQPLLLEQGAPAEERDKDVQAFWAGGALKPWSNVQFGEGGAGTFSDGKLATGIRDPEGRIREVLRIFADCGADPSICYDAKPHIGTDCLKNVVRMMRQQITEKGGSFLFHTRLIGMRTEKGRLKAACTENTVTGEKREIPAEAMILAIGHSARETFLMLHEAGVEMLPKGFAVGVRIEHPQSLINRIQYGTENPENLPPADYKLTAKVEEGRSVYSFCMCPGGQVVNASSEEGRLAVNGMSLFARDDVNSNSALLVNVGPEDYGSPHPLAGMHFQRRLEEEAFRAGGADYKAPACTVGELMDRKLSCGEGRVKPSYRPAVSASLPDEYLPPVICESLRLGIPEMGKMIRGFDDREALLTGIESRSSSPVRILRGEDMQSLSAAGLYPCGEGAGYAGGIVSAAVDGMKCSNCAANVQNAFNGIDGVWARVNLGRHRAEVLAKKEMKEETFTEALKGTGYKVTGVELVELQ